MSARAAARLSCAATGALASLLVTVAFASPARASEPFPAAMRDDLGLMAAPGCDLCHEAAKDPVGAADKPFSVSAEKRGLVAGDVESLQAALDQMRADGVDSDGDGAQDLDELSWGGDPNHADLLEGGTQAPPSYGCAVSPAGEDEPAAIAALLASALLASRRRERRARSRSISV
ncbi:MAG: MYXO-CTERM sorting domain-containing protein [Byssovorax sp.]